MSAWAAPEVIRGCLPTVTLQWMGRKNQWPAAEVASLPHAALRTREGITLHTTIIKSKRRTTLKLAMPHEAHIGVVRSPVLVERITDVAQQLLIVHLAMRL